MSLYLGENLISGSKPINLGVRNIGEIVSSSLPLTDAGLHLLDGSLILGGGIYQGFVDYIADLYGDGTNIPSYFCTESEWQTAVTTYGVCGKFVYDSVNNTVRLPKITGIIEGTTDVNALGDLVKAGLPIHTHTRGTMNITGQFGARGMEYTNVISNGAYYIAGAHDVASGSGTTGVYFGFDASRSWTGNTSNPVYSGDIQNSSTVQPQTIKCFVYIVIANSTKTELQVDIDEVATDLNGKADTDLSNVPNSKGILTESYVNGNSWYRVYSDGWCEQGGLVVQGSGTSGSITFLKPFKNTDYTVVSNCGNNSTNIHVFIVNTYDGKTTSGVSWFKSASGLSGDWRACGYIN